MNDAKSPMRTRAENGRDEVETRIGTGVFEVRFPRRESGDRALRMISWTDRTIFALEPGMKFEDVHFLRPGTQFADKANGRMTLHVNSEGQNYYVEEQVQKHSDGQEKVLFERAELRADLKVDTLFVTAVIDLNENKTVDLGEYEYFKIRVIG